LIEEHVEYIAEDDDYMIGMVTKMSFDKLIRLPLKAFPNRDLYRSTCRIKAPILGFVSSEYSDQEETPSDESDLPHSGDIQLKPMLTFNSTPIPVLSCFCRNLLAEADDFGCEEEDYFCPEDTRIYGPIRSDMIEEVLAPVYASYKKPKTRPSPEELESLMDEDEPTPKQRRKARGPQFVPFIETIPSEIRDFVIKSVANSFVVSFATQNCAGIVGPLVNQKKKQMQRKLKEAKAHRARIEEKQKMDAMRERRIRKINDLADVTSGQFVRGFIVGEIGKIYKDLEVEFAKETESAETGDDSGCEPVPIAANGFVYGKRPINQKKIVDAFNGLRFSMDENGEPKIRYRFVGNRIEVLLFFATKEDARRALLQGTIQIDGYTTVQLSAADNLEHQVMESYTGQRILFVGMPKNMETLCISKGIMGLLDMCPIADLSGFHER
jgi:hypothetical protein